MQRNYQEPAGLEQPDTRTHSAIDLMRIPRAVFVALVPLFIAAIACAQPPQGSSSSEAGRTIKAIGYQVGRGSTTVELKSTGLLKGVDGQAKVEAKTGLTSVEARTHGLTPPMELGSEFLTYVLWSVSPEGRAMNLGEILSDRDGWGKLKATTPFQSFSLFVTAEPYSAVRQPSEMLVLQNEIRKNTKGKIFIVSNYQLMKRSQYEKLGNPLALSMDLKNVPLALYEARNAVEIAKARGASQYAPDIFSKAESGLSMAERALTRGGDRKAVTSLARQSAQFSEDARILTVERQEAQRIAEEKAAAATRARAEAEAEGRRKADEEARRQAELAAAREAQMRAEAAAKEAQMKAAAEIAAARAKAEADALRAREEAAKGEADRAFRASEELRAQLLEQFNRILETRDTVRGLVITMGDVLFDTGKYDLRMNAREILAKISGILLAHPGLSLEVEGHTDSTGSDELNQRLSERRANAVRDYLIGQGLFGETTTARGLGKDMPVASNDTAAGRQKNRRVELIVSGEVIGVKIGK